MGRVRARFLLLRILSAIRCSPSRPGRSAARSWTRGGAVLPGVTVEARSDGSARPARHGDRLATATYQLPALPPGDYTVTFSLDRHADGDATGRRSSSAKTTAGDATMTLAGVTEDGHGDGAESPMIDKNSAAITSGLSNDQHQEPAGRHAVSRSDQADPRRAVHAGPGARPERGRQRPGQRLQLRRRQRDAAALRHAVGRARVARHRADHGRQGRRQGDRLQPRGRIRRRLGQQVRHEHLPRPGRLPASRTPAWRRR